MPRWRAPSGTLSDFEMLVGARGEQLDIAMPPDAELERAVVAAAARTPGDFTFGDERFASRVARLEGNRDDAPILSGGGNVARTIRARRTVLSVTR